MTPTELITAARDLYNATGDTYFSDTQILNWIWQACHVLAKEAWLIERTYTTTTVAGTQDYSFPTNTIAIKRLLVNGKKLKNITHRYDDSITLSNQTATTQGWPIYYTLFNYTASLRPIPDAAYTMTVYSFNDAQQITTTSTLEIPTLFHFDTTNYVLEKMALKDKALDLAEYHRERWEGNVQRAIAYKKRMKRADSFVTVQSEDVLPVTIVGEA